MKFVFYWPSGFRREDVSSIENQIQYMGLPGTGADNIF